MKTVSAAAVDSLLCLQSVVISQAEVLSEVGDAVEDVQRETADVVVAASAIESRLVAVVTAVLAERT